MDRPYKFTKQCNQGRLYHMNWLEALRTPEVPTCNGDACKYIRICPRNGFRIYIMQ